MAVSKLSNLSIGKTYTFRTVSPVFLDSEIASAKLKSIVDADIARTFSPIDQTWASVYPTLPEGTPNDVNLTTFYIFEALNKSKIVMAAAWIVDSSITEISAVTITATLPRAALADVEKLRLALSAAGFTDFDIKTS